MPVDTEPSDPIPIDTTAADMEPSNPIPVNLAPSTLASNVAGSASTPFPSNKDEGASGDIAAPADLLQSHYDFLPAFVQSLHPSGSHPITNKDWNTVLLSLGYRKDRHPQPSFSGAMYDFIMNIKIKNDTDSLLECPPAVIHDLAEGSPTPLALASNISAPRLCLRKYGWGSSGDRLQISQEDAMKFSGSRWVNLMASNGPSAHFLLQISYS